MRLAQAASRMNGMAFLPTITNAMAGDMNVIREHKEAASMHTNNFLIKKLQALLPFF